MEIYRIDQPSNSRRIMHAFMCLSVVGRQRDLHQHPHDPQPGDGTPWDPLV